MNGKHLFADGYLRDALEAHRQKMLAAIDRADASQVGNGQSIDDIADTFVQEFVVDTPVLTEGAVSVDVVETKVDFEYNLKLIQEYLGRVSNDVKTFNASLRAFARERVKARQTRLEQLHQGVSGLGIPIRRPGVSAASSASAATNQKTIKKALPQETFDVALSFAGEQRDYVEQVAAGLRDAGISVFYDAFQRANLWGKNLVDHLAEVYQKGSRYVVMFISKEYVEKAWPTHERQHAQARALLAKEEYILPARFDDTDVPGLTTTVGHVDLRNTTPAELVTLIQAKLVKSR
jgi:hypothetical protein